MVGVAIGTNTNRQKSVLARATVVNEHLNVVYDTFVRPEEKVVDFRTWVSGVRPRHLNKAPRFEEVKEKIAELLRDKIIVGHALNNDFKVLEHSHPQHLIRDTAKYPPFTKDGKSARSLKNLSKDILVS